ncbi:MAG: PD-(D/E)XK nuclease family protein, partial [Chloroflexota bacterium]
MQVLLARVGAGKTIAVQDRLMALKQERPLAKVWVLLSTERQIADFRQRFTRHSTVSFNVEYFNFYSLYHHLLAVAGNPQRCLDDTARFALIRALLGDLYREGGGIFGGIAQTPGFIKIIAAFLYELKQNLVDPLAFANAAKTPKEVELAYIYTEYQLALRRFNLVDREGEGWLALEALAQFPKLAQAVDLLIVDGYDQFNALQAELLTTLGTQVRDALVTLTTIAGREATIGKRFADALGRLQHAHDRRGLSLEAVHYSAPVDARTPALKHLSEQLLRPRPQQAEAGSAVHWLEAPDPASEIGALLRRVKRLLLNGCPPDDILIALRDWTLYGGQVSAQGAVYDLPLALHYGDPLARNPAVVALLDLLSLHAGDFRRRALLDALRSPYFSVPGLDTAQVDLLERISLDLRITGGRQAWLEAVDLIARAPKASSDEEQDFAPLRVDPARATTLKRALSVFFNAVTPPEQGTVAAYIVWLERLVGQDVPDPDEAEAAQAPVYNFDMPNCIRADADAPTIARDLAAMSSFKGVLRGLLSAQVLAGSLGYARPLDRATFLRDLRTAVDATTVERGTPRDGRVLVTTVTDARGLPHRHIFIPGLSEGIFPMPSPEDPLLLDSERTRLRALGIDLPTQAERAADDGLFYSLLSQARESLTLSRPHSKNGEPWAASHLWRATRAVFSDSSVERLKLGDVPADPATRHETALAAAAGLSEGKASGGLLRWIDPAYWNRIRRARDLELNRQSDAAHDHYTGRLRDPALLGWVGQHFGEDRVWSASQLNAYGLCGFRYFAGRLLKLEPLQEPEDGMDSRQLGTLYHEILEATYRRLGGAVTPERLDEALAVLNAVADEKMASAPQRLRFRVSPQWTQEQSVLRRKLERLIRDDFSGENPFIKPFGGAPREVYAQEAFFDDLTLDLGGEPLRVRGSIDRIDRQGERVILVDYKTGSAPIRKDEIARGRNFQMMVYLLAAQALLERDDSPEAPREVAGGLFWQIGGASLGDLKAEDAEIIDAGKAHLSRYLAQARSG